MGGPSGRERLLAATRDLLHSHGFEATSPRDIQRQSGVGQGSFYHHFDSKQSLAAAALREVRDQLAAELDDTLSDAAPLVRLQRYLTLPRDALTGCRLGRLAMERSVIDADDLRGPVAEYFAFVQERIEASVREAVQAGDLPATLDARDTAATLVAVVQGGYVLSRVHGDGVHLERATRGALGLLGVGVADG